MSKPQVHKLTFLVFFNSLPFSVLFLSADSAQLRNKPRDCFGKVSVDDFRNCINETDLRYLKTINIESYIQEQHINFWGIHHIITPSDGSIKNKGIIKTNSSRAIPPTFILIPTYEYNLYLFDRDAFLYSRNPSVIKRSFLRVQANTSMVTIYIKVSRLICLLLFFFSMIRLFNMKKSTQKEIHVKNLMTILYTVALSKILCPKLDADLIGFL